LFSPRINESNIDDYIITVDRDETIPLGNEYFFIVVPTTIYAVNNIAVSIQTVMDIFYNIPSIYNENNGTWRKKSIIFVDELNTLRRMQNDLSNAVKRLDVVKREWFGLQDLRNPWSNKFVNEYSDDEKVINNISMGQISYVLSTKAWEDGELWWGYMLDTIVNNSGNTTPFNNVVIFSSREHGDIMNADLIVSTSSLEVGVDYSDVVLIYQHGAPLNIASLIQRAGRGGRRMYENPLMRAVVGIQLSHELPHQAWLFEIFTRVKSLRDALNYDMLYLPIDSEELIKQTIAELAIEYSILNDANKLKYECEIIRLLKFPNDDFIDYAYGVFRELINKEKIKDYAEKIGNELYHLCEKGERS
jgi:Lhr-like helicases